jgi:hypothetical protein
MKLKDVYQNVALRLQKQMNIQSSLTIMNIPKQKMLDRGDLVMLLDEKLEVLSTEWLRDGFYHVEIKDPMPSEDVKSIMKQNSIRVFETDGFDSTMDVDRVIDYKQLPPPVKKLIKKFVLSTEHIFEVRYTKFGRKADKQTWLQAIIKQNGMFTLWCEENGYNGATTEAINKAYAVGDATSDWQLKRRAAMAKCFNKIKIKRDNS